MGSVLTSESEAGVVVNECPVHVVEFYDVPPSTSDQDLGQLFLADSSQPSTAQKEEVYSIITTHHPSLI